MADGFTALEMTEAPHWSRGVLGASRLQCEKTAPPSRVQGAQPPPGVQRVPLFLKTLEGGAGGIAAQAKPNPPLKEGAGHNKTIRPHRRADAGVRGPRHTPLQNKNNCAIVPP